MKPLNIDPVLVAERDAEDIEKAHSAACNRLSDLNERFRDHIGLPKREDMPEDIRIHKRAGYRISRDDIEAYNRDWLDFWPGLARKLDTPLDHPIVAIETAKQQELATRRLAWWDAENEKRKSFERQCGYAAAGAEEQATLHQLFAACDRIATTPATTFAGVIAKIRMVHRDIADGACPGTTEVTALANAIADIERLAKGSAA